MASGRESLHNALKVSSGLNLPRRRVSSVEVGGVRASSASLALILFRIAGGLGGWAMICWRLDAALAVRLPS